MDNEKLNEKLLKFAGMAYATNDEPTITRYTITPPPDFTDPIWGIAHCFKWLVPEAIKKIIAESGCDIKLAYGLIFRWWLEKLDPTEPALSLCLAIEKLIEAENEYLNPSD